MRQPILNINKPQPPLVIEKMLPNLIWRLPQEEKTVYITFDDGPVPYYTEKVIDCLNSYNITGTFFCVGENINRHPDLYAHLQEKGHTVGSHTYNHLNSWKCTNNEYIENVHKGARHINTHLFRPPHGKIRFKQSKQLIQKYDIIMWDVISKDYDKSLTGLNCFENVKNYVQNGSIIVFHDSQKAFKNCMYALPKTIDYLLQNNYSIQNIPLNISNKKSAV
ncbi:MAG: polysaccharide deacetylase family protein [Bacteroidales bacterium]|nr:polysaccharide deacetylase family protein [Bacteroidales bacterium]